MKKIIFSTLILAFSVSLFAQPAGFNDLYYDYKGEEGVVALKIPGFVMKLAGSIADRTRSLAGCIQPDTVDRHLPDMDLATQEHGRIEIHGNPFGLQCVSHKKKNRKILIIS